MSGIEFNKSLWYLVRKDRQSKPWTFFVILLSFKTATQADTWAELYGYSNYFPMKGRDILEKQKDEAAGLANLRYITADIKSRSNNQERKQARRI